MKIVNKKITKRDGKATISMALRFENGRLTVFIAKDGGIGMLAHGDVKWEQALEAVYTAVDEVLILNS